LALGRRRHEASNTIRTDHLAPMRIAEVTVGIDFGVLSYPKRRETRIESGAILTTFHRRPCLPVDLVPDFIEFSRGSGPSSPPGNTNPRPRPSHRGASIRRGPKGDAADRAWVGETSHDIPIEIIVTVVMVTIIIHDRRRGDGGLR